MGRNNVEIGYQHRIWCCVSLHCQWVPLYRPQRSRNLLNPDSVYHCWRNVKAHYQESDGGSVYGERSGCARHLAAAGATTFNSALHRVSGSSHFFSPLFLACTDQLWRRHITFNAMGIWSSWVTFSIDGRAVLLAHPANEWAPNNHPKQIELVSIFIHYYRVHDRAVNWPKKKQTKGNNNNNRNNHFKKKTERGREEGEVMILLLMEIGKKFIKKTEICLKNKEKEGLQQQHSFFFVCLFVCFFN